MDIKSLYYKLNNDEFNKYLENNKLNPNTLILFKGTNHERYFILDNDILNRLIELTKLDIEFNNLINSLSEFSKKQLIQYFLIEEIESTNKIENIISTKHDIYYILNNYKTDDEELISITNSYLYLLNNDYKINELKDIRNIYDNLLNSTIKEENLPDGKLFRKDIVYITDGINNIHKGFLTEEKINKGLEEFISLYNNENINIYLRSIITHYMLEAIHPFYDGNGRLGRFLFSLNILNNSKSYFSFLISKSLSENKQLYYKALKQIDDYNQFGFINNYVLDILKILILEISNQIEELKYNIDRINNYNIEYKFSKNELLIYKLLCEGSVFSYIGISNEEIKNELNISIRSINYSIDKFRSLNLITDTIINKKIFHKIK